MRIGFYSPNYPGINGPGGIGTYTRELAHALVSRGHSVHVLIPGISDSIDDVGVLVHSTSIQHIPLIDRCLPGAGACWRVGGKMKELAKRYALDIVEFANWEGLALWYQLSKSTPVVIRLSTSSKETQEIEALNPSRRLLWDVKREHTQAKRADLLVTHSKAHQARMSDELRVAAGEIRIVPHGVSVPNEYSCVRFNSRLSVVFLGRLELRKGTLELLKAIPQVLQAYPTAEFTFIGTDRNQCPGNRTHAQWASEELSGDVLRSLRFLGSLPQSDVDRHLKNADVFIAPSRYESFGLVFPEAMRWGTPVIGTRCGGIPEIIEDGKSGLLVPPERPDEIAKALCRLLGDEALRHKLGEGGRRRIESHFSISRMAERVEAMYSEVLAHARSIA